jgi:hypothetical protein
MTDTRIDQTTPDPEDWLSSFLGDLETPHDFTGLQMSSIGGTPFHSTMHPGTEQPPTAQRDFSDGRGASLGLGTGIGSTTNSGGSSCYDDVEQEQPPFQRDDAEPALLNSEIIPWDKMDKASQQRLKAWYKLNEIKDDTWADKEIRKLILEAVKPGGTGKVTVDQSKIYIVSHSSNIIDCRRCDTALKQLRDNRRKCGLVIVCPEHSPRANWATLKCQRCSNRESQRKKGRRAEEKGNDCSTTVRVDL